MTEKRFKHKRNQLGMQFICYDDKTELLGTFADADGVNNIVTLLNDLSEENEQLKQEYWKVKHRHSLLHDVCLDAECERDSLKKDVESLEKENEQLKDILKDITIQLDANHTMNTYQMVIPINRVIYNELNRRLKETSFNEELKRVLDD